MEPVTHVLTGACLSRAGLNRRAAYSTITLAIAAEFPDIDTLWSLRGPVASFQHHRGITHTFVGIPVEAGLILAAVYVVHRIREGRAAKASPAKLITIAPVRWGLLYGFALLGLLSHIALDFTNNYGVRPFSPFNPRWYAGSFVFIFDPVIFLLLLSAFIMPPLFALIGSEVGSRKPKFRGRGWATAALVCVASVWGLRAFEHARAEQIASAQSMRVPGMNESGEATSQFLQPTGVQANPDPLNPFLWHVVSDFGAFYQLGEVNALTGSLTPAQDIRPKPEHTPAIVAAQGSALGRAYMDWSPMPLITESRPGDPLRTPADADDPMAPSAANTVVTFSDPRFIIDIPMLRSRAHPPLTGMVELDSQNRVVRQTMDGAVQR